MFPSIAKLSLLALIAPLVSATIVFEPIRGAESTGELTIKWTYEESDPAEFHLELLNKIFNNAFAISNTVDKTLGELTVQIGVVPIGDGYTLQAVALDDINEVFGESAPFRVDALGTNGSVTASSYPPTSSSSGTASSSRSASGSSTGSSASVPTSSVASFTRNIQSNSISTPSGSSTAAPSSTDLSAPINGNNGAGSLQVGSTATMAAALLSVVAGAAVFAL